MLREKGDFGGEHVKIEDRLITASLRAYDGAERDQVVNLFNLFAIFPEDIPIPRLTGGKRTLLSAAAPAGG